MSLYSVLCSGTFGEYNRVKPGKSQELELFHGRRGILKFEEEGGRGSVEEGEELGSEHRALYAGETPRGGKQPMAPPDSTSPISVSEEYRRLVDKSFSNFSRLREFPPYGRNKWDVYFHKAFQVYSKLWKFQMENRQKLVETGLKRWEIGEIASRIGQLYYNYYLRTSDAKFLSESYIFYEAIVSREYFKDTGKDTGKDTSLANKHLRFYARFIVVCLLLNRREMVHHLIKQFRVLVDDYSPIFQGNDAKEWKLVVQEIMRFMQADAFCAYSRPLRYSVLLDPHPALLREVSSAEVGRTLRLQDAILASYYHNEVKFNELTLDTFRMLQSIEWEPTGLLYRTRSSDAGSNAGSVGAPIVNKGSLQLQIPDPSLPSNPHKYILYRPTVTSMLLVLATACEELSSDCILLLYISAAGSFFAGNSKPPRNSQTGSVSASSGSEVNMESPTEVTQRSGSVDPNPGDTMQDQNGGFPSSSQRSSHQKSGNNVGTDTSTSVHSGGLWLGSKRNTGANYLYPSDLLPFTRRPLILVIDSDNSSAFEIISGRERGEPAALLLSPIAQPVYETGSLSSSSSVHSGGNLFTLFLTAPLLAFCRVVGVSSPDLQMDTYERLEKLVSTLSLQFGDLLAASPSIELTWGQILGDPFLRQLVFRFVLCRATLKLHALYGSRNEYLPRCLPHLPEEALPTHTAVESCVFQLATKLGVVDQFTFSLPSPDPKGSNGELKWIAKSRVQTQLQEVDEKVVDHERPDSARRT